MDSSMPRFDASRPSSQRRKHSVPQFVFSSNMETETRDCSQEVTSSGRTREKNTDRAFLNRYGMLNRVVQDQKDEKICFIHNHKVIRATKVYINVYHLWKKYINVTMKYLGMGGGYHAAIEIMGREYHFGASNRVDSGIFDSRPLHLIQKSKRRRSSDSPKNRGDVELMGEAMATKLGSLKERIVVGLWSGSEADIEVFMRHLKEKGNWKGLNYKLLTFNCNHFVRDACQILLKQSRYFHPAKGMISTDTMVPTYLFKLPNLIKSRCMTFVLGEMEEEEIRPPREQQFAFRGRGRCSATGFEEYYKYAANVRETTTQPDDIMSTWSGSACSLPELRLRRVQALDKKNKQTPTLRKCATAKARLNRNVSTNSTFREGQRLSGSWSVSYPEGRRSASTSLEIEPVDTRSPSTTSNDKFVAAESRLIEIKPASPLPSQLGLKTQKPIQSKKKHIKPSMMPRPENRRGGEFRSKKMGQQGSSSSVSSLKTTASEWEFQINPGLASQGDDKSSRTISTDGLQSKNNSGRNSSISSYSRTIESPKKLKKSRQPSGRLTSMSAAK